MKPYSIVILFMRQMVFAVSVMFFLFGCSKRAPFVEKRKFSHVFTKLPANVDERLNVFADSLLVIEAEQPWMDSVLNAIGTPGWEHAAFGIQNGFPSVMIPLIDYEARKVTGLVVMVNSDRFRFRVIDARKPERYGYNNGKNVANARTIFIAADLFNQRAFPDQGPAGMADPCMMTRMERRFFENARKAGGDFTPMVKAAGYALSVTCYTSMACTGDGYGNCVGNIVYHTDCLYNYIWVDGSGGYYMVQSGGSMGGGGAGGVGSASPDETASCDGSAGPAQEDGGPLAVLPPTKPIADVKEYINCFDRNANAKITFYADQPQSGTDEPFTVKGKVGHAFITIEQFTGGSIIRRTIGFHPYEAISPFFAKESQSQLGDDSDEPYDVRLDVNISSDVLSNVMFIIENYNQRYHIENYNCTNFVMDISDACGLKIPRTRGNWIIGSGLNPGSFGEDLKKMPGAVDGQGKSDENIGNCN